MKFLAVVIIIPLVSGVYRPPQAGKFQWQLQVDSHHHFDYSHAADVYDTDLWAITTQDIRNIHHKGAKVICYFSAGSYDPNRDDAGSFDQHHDVGHTMEHWSQEKWINIKSSNVKRIMGKRMDLAKSKGCDGIEPDNVDVYSNHNTGFHFTASDQLAYNKWLATEAHSRQLSIALKNDVDQISQLHSYFDFAINEECHEYNECSKYQPFLSEGKAVFNIEYVSNHKVTSSDTRKCTHGQPHGMKTQFKDMDVTSWAHYCPGQTTIVG